MSWIIDQKSNKDTIAPEENPTKISRDFHCSAVHVGVMLMGQRCTDTFILSAVTVGKDLQCPKLAQKILLSNSLVLSLQYDEVNIFFFFVFHDV